MPPPSTRRSTRVDQVAEQLELGRDLGAADQRGERPLRVLERAAQRLDLGLHQPARRRGQALGQPGDRGMRAMRRRERVVDVELAERAPAGRRTPDRSSPRRHGSAGSRAAATSPGRSASTARLAGSPMQSSANATSMPPERRPERRAQRRERHRALALALGPAEVRQHDDLGALVQQLLHGRHRALDAGRVGDLAVLHRHVEVEPDQHRAPGHLQILERAQVAPSAALGSQRAEDRRDVAHAAGEAPLVVVPGRDADQLALEHLGRAEIDRRAVAVVVEVDRDQRLAW